MKLYNLQPACMMQAGMLAPFSFSLGFRMFITRAISMFNGAYLVFNETFLMYNGTFLMFNGTFLMFNGTKWYATEHPW